MSKYNYTDVKLDFAHNDQIGIITLNRPKSLNAFGGKMMPELISALRELNEHPTSIFTVITGEGRFFSAGADIKGVNDMAEAQYATVAEKKIAFMGRFASAMELMRSLIDHKKVFVLALNGPGVGGGAAWFQGSADLVYAAKNSWLQIPFSALGLVPENGSALNFAQSMGVHRANEFLMLGRRTTAEELESWGLVNKIFEQEGFRESVVGYLKEQLADKDGKSMMEAKRLMNAPLRAQRILAVVESIDALSERFVEDAPKKRFEAKKRELEEKAKNKGSKL